MLKKLIVGAACIAATADMVITIAAFGAAVNPDTRLVSGYIRDYYNTEFSYVSDIPTQHKGEIKVAVMHSVSCGNYGYTRDGGYISYNKYVTPGESVTSYLIYSPDSDEPDDVVAVVDNSMIR